MSTSVFELGGLSVITQAHPDGQRLSFAPTSRDYASLNEDEVRLLSQALESWLEDRWRLRKKRIRRAR